MSGHSLLYSRRRFIAALAGAGLGGAVTDLWAHDTPFPTTCRVRTARIPGPSGWAGKTIVFLTDIHYGYAFGPAEAADLNRLVGQQAPDLVLLGGDLAHQPSIDLTDFFARWSPPCPTLFAPGNHDLPAGSAGAGPVISQARAAGITVLLNARERWNGLTVIGFPSALRRPQHIGLLHAPGLKLVLAHEPDTWDRYRGSDFVQLAGHTHGGQIRIFNQPICLPELGEKYPLGRFTADAERTLLVSAGVGCTGVPARVNCPPEIYRLELT